MASDDPRFRDYDLFKREMPSDVLVALRGENGMTDSTWMGVVRETREGVEASAALRTHDWTGKQVTRLSAKRLEAFWKYAEGLDCWNLTDWSDAATDLSGYDVFLRRGPRVLRISCCGFVGASTHRLLVERVQRITGIDALWDQAWDQRSAR